MIITLASDHAGTELKSTLCTLLESTEAEVHDLGPHDTASVDYPDFAHRLAAEVESGRADLGVLICGTGLGMSMAANRHPGVRAALCHDAFTAEMARRHNNANVVCIGARVTGESVAEQIVRVFIETPFEGDRHSRRVNKINCPQEAPTEES
ncbi:MAG: ribose 5-phosphate isomerase B [bacterium]|nr:ribose 5-phosphate isomerase B [bacterium]